MAGLNKLEYLALLLSGDADETTISRALTIIHNDVIRQNAVAANYYISKGLVEGLVRHCRSSRNLLIHSLAVSLVTSLSHYDVQVLDKFYRLGGINLLMAMITSRDNSAELPIKKDHTLLLHEQAAKLLMEITALTHRRDMLNDLVGLGIIPRAVELCLLFYPSSVHQSCCRGGKSGFSDTAVDVTKGLVHDKKLIGKIYTDESTPVRSGALNVFSIELFDTTTDKDININQELLKQEFVWPDPLPDFSIEETKKSHEKKIEETVWSDIVVTKVHDTHCLWAHVGGEEVEGKVKSISNLIQDWVLNNEPEPLDEVGVGDNVCFCISETSFDWMRGRVLRTDSTDENKIVATVLTSDHGLVVNVNQKNLYSVPNMVKEIPYKASLCNLKGIQAAPKRVRILEYAAGILANILYGGHALRMKVHGIGGTTALLQLLPLPNRGIILRTLVAISNMALHHTIRPHVGHCGCKLVLDICRAFSEDVEVLKAALGCLLHFLIECMPNRNRVADEGGLFVFMKIYRAYANDKGLQSLVLSCLKNLIGDGWRLIDPINIPDVRGIIEEQIDDMKGSFDLPNLCGDELLEEVIKRRERKAQRKGAVAPAPTYASMTVNDLVKKLKGDGESSDEGTRSEGYRTGPDTDGEEEKFRSLFDYGGYIYKRKCHFIEDSTHAFMFEPQIRQVKAVNISKTICAFLNSGEGGTIYVGIDLDGRTVGLNISRKERDNLRLGIDDLLQRFTPNVRHDKYQIKFQQVMWGTSSNNLQQYEEKYIVEIIVEKSSGKLYRTPSSKMYFRDGNKNKEYSMQDIREKTIQEQEVKYQAEIETLRMSLAEARNQLKTTKNAPAFFAE